MAWLVGGARVLPEGHFGTVLTAQALYGVLQMVSDNGTSLFGARRSARGELEVKDRHELARARLLLAICCAAVGLGVAKIGGADLLLAFAPFAVAMVLFSILNVWERYGLGDVVPFAGYLLLRSLLIGALAGGAAIKGADLPLEAAGVCELAAILVVGFGCSAWTLPRGGFHVRTSTWRSTRDIGLPAVLTQYNVAVGTIVLGVTGQTSAAAISGVAFRLLTGVQGLNGAVAAAVFPRLARVPEPEARDARAGQLAATGGVVLAGAALLVVAVAAGPVVKALLDGQGAVKEAAVVVALGAAGATGLVMHRAFALVAGEQERLLRRATAFGAAVVTTGSIAAVFIDGQQSALVVLAAFTAGQVVTLGVIGAAGAGADRRLTVAATAVLPGLGAVMALVEGARLPLAAVALVIAVLAAARWQQGARAAGRRARTLMSDDG